MKKFLGVVAAYIPVGAPAFAQSNLEKLGAMAVKPVSCNRFEMQTCRPIKINYCCSMKYDRLIGHSENCQYAV